MSIPSIKFKKMLVKLNQFDRMTVLNRLVNWLQQQGGDIDSTTSNLLCWLTNLSSMNFLPDDEFKVNNIWFMASSFDNCISFQEIVKAKLDIPKRTIKEIKEKPSRKSIPKKIRADVWENAFGASTQGKCHCCNCDLNCLGSWHAGHIIASCNGGSDTADNLRPICASCNLSMGSEHMDAFKARCYPPTSNSYGSHSEPIMINGRLMNIITRTH